jgi:hypothetical protein
LVPIVEKTGWAQGLIWMGMWNLTPNIHAVYFEFQISHI